jgi:cytochrome c-type biogenesis protein CcmH/NrfG
MTLLLASMLMAAVVAAWAVAPIVSRRLALIGDPVPGGILDAEARRRVALASLKEIEYDRVGGKLDESDYEALRARLEREALLAIRAAEGAHRELEDFEITHSCGFVNPSGSRFCSGCGARLG